MKKFIFIALALALALALAAANACAADSFDGRVAAAKKMLDTREGQDYNSALFVAIGIYMQKAMAECFPKGVARDTSNFTLVADILANGTATRVEVRPDTKMATCVGNKFARAPFPALPPNTSANGFPYEIEMKITD